MKAPKEIAKKIREYKKLENRTKRLFKEITKWFNENGADGVSIEDIFVSVKPSGQNQNGDEYCDQSSWGDSGDSFSGSYYHQVEGSNEYVGYKYWC